MPLPLRRSGENAHAHPEAHTPAPVSGASRGGPRPAAGEASGAGPMQPELVILLIEPDERRRNEIRASLEELGLATREATNGPEALAAIRERRPNLILASLLAQGLDAASLLRSLTTSDSIPVVFQTATPDLAATVAVMSQGARHVFLANRDFQALAQGVKKLIAPPRSSRLRELERRIPGSSATSQCLRKRLLALARLRVPVLIRGEPGSEREALARTLHEFSDDPTTSFLMLRPDDDLQKTALKRPAVVYLHDLDALSPAAQNFWLARLSGAPSTGIRPHRIIASTTRDLEAIASSNAFDPNLASAVGRFKLIITPLRERAQDVPHLTRLIASEATRRMGCDPVIFTAPAIAALREHSWPNNLDELQITVERSIAFASNGRITRKHVRSVLAEDEASVAALRREGEEHRKRELLQLLQDCGGNLAEAARRAGLSRGAIIYRAQKFGLLPHRAKSR
jgi:DNA-binding NtrC family response regulator